MKNKINKLVKITHKDLNTISLEEGLAWHTKEQLLKCAEHDYSVDFYSVGILVEKNDRYVVIAPNYSMDGDKIVYSDASMLPSGIIINIEEI